MDFLKDIWLQGGAAGVLVGILGYANWLQWKRAVTKDEQHLTLTREVSTAMAKASASSETIADALDGNTTAVRELSLLVAGRGPNR